MRPWTNAPTSTGAGVLRPEQFREHVEMRRHPAGEDLAPWIENVWTLRWDLPDGVVFPSQTLPHPSCTVSVERASHPRPEVGSDPVVVTGVVTRRFDVEARGHARVLGVKFRPGGLVAFAGGRAREWTDRTVPARSLLPAAVCDGLASVDLDGDPAAAAGAALEALASVRPEAVDPRYERLLTIVADMLEDRSLVSVAQVEARHAVSARSLQRWCTDLVGVGPKWVLARYRMHDAVAELDAGFDGPLTDLAHRFGWFDQAHFTRDFVDLVGVTPGHYRRRG
ncbi:MAG: helix-turn-helix domain-containing protein [Nocardioidaceae bacterium]